MTVTNHNVGYRKPNDSQLDTLKFDHKIIFNEHNYTFEKSIGLGKWIIKAGEVLFKMINEINDFNKEKTSSVRIYNIKVLECNVPQIIFTKNKIQIQFYYELINSDNNIIRNGHITDIAKKSLTDLGLSLKLNYSRNKKFIIGLEFSLYYCLEACLISLSKEIENLIIN